jgi:pyruvate kinase
MKSKKVKIIVTLGPSTDTIEDLRRIKDKGVDFVRINMSHSNINSLKEKIQMAKTVGIPFIIDTEGSQVRTGDLITNTITLEENDEIKIYKETIVGDATQFNLRPNNIISQLQVGDLIDIDFDGVTLRVSDVSTIEKGYIVANALIGGVLGKNKAVVIDTVSNKKLVLPSLSKKDHQSIQIGIEEGIGHIAASFMRSGKAVDEVRQATQNTMQIISKVECIDALENLDEIIKKSDFILIDRGDLSKEIPLEKIPFTQKIILNKGKKYGTPIFVATNLLETMIDKKNPTRAEIHDIINTIVDGAEGLTLAAETAIGKYPMECINMMNNLISHAKLAINVEEFKNKEELFVQKLESKNYLLDFEISSSLIPPHGGKLINRMTRKEQDPSYLASLPKIKIDNNRQRDVEQIAIGTYSPIEGFMGKEDFNSVLDRTRLSNGLVWPLPIFLDVPIKDANRIEEGKDVALVDESENILAILHLDEKFTINQEEMANKLYTTDNQTHPGVQRVIKMHPILLGGKITLLKRSEVENKEYEITPRQARKLFEARGWSKVIGFHTRNVIHRGHEFIQMEGLKKEYCDGLFVHPVVGKKKKGDFNAKYIIESYSIMKKNFYPKEKVIFGTFSTYSRYAGPREALFTALCRKNFGCSHFIVGRDHTGVGNFYHSKASHNIFDRFPEIGIKPVRFNNIFYSKKLRKHLHEIDVPNHPEDDKYHVSGNQARQMFEEGKQPPEWFMHPKISQMIIDSLKNGEDVFVK